MADDLSALLDAFERGTAPYSTVRYSTPLEHAPEPEPAEPWHNEPATGKRVARPPVASPIVYKPDAPKPARKTPDELNWRECWLRIGKLYSGGHMDAAQYHDLIAASDGWRASGFEKPPSELLEKVRMALWAFVSIDEERESDRARRASRNRRVHS